ncbi:MAG: chorismate-binding protein [Verrucomicrobia bacterium]|nr:chorismate-binding protein [Verrucomicrobiota bacterium]
MDLAFFRLPDGRTWIGEGPFTELATPPDGAAFYVNDFVLADPKPWKVPTRLIEIKSAADLERFLPTSKPLRIAWQMPGTEWFKMVFRRIRRDVLAQRLRKMVPVLTETGVVVEGDPASLLRRAFDAPTGFWAYARIKDGAGFVGATPEMLLTRTGSNIQTMALAGTAKPSGAEDFTTDVKEIEEHELVANFLEETLNRVGDVMREQREISVAGGLTHFRTRFSAELRSVRDDAALVRLLHPTPAVGCLPRDEPSLSKLMEYRHQLGAGDFFGAPFGFRDGGDFHCAVAIRGISWSGSEVKLPCGCGIVAGSAFDHEWRELRQKREAVAKLFGV